MRLTLHTSQITALLLIAALCAPGCRARQHAHILKDTDKDMVGSHEAGASVYKPLVDESVAKLLGRQYSQIMQVSHNELPAPPKRVCFVGVENKSAEAVGDFKEQIYQMIDSQLLQAPTFDPISRRYVDAALAETRLRPDSLMIPDNMRVFSAVLERQGQPFDYLMYATITSGTTQTNGDYQRDYVLTLEIVNVRTGQYDKESAELRKSYHKSVASKWYHFGLK